MKYRFRAVLLCAPACLAFAGWARAQTPIPTTPIPTTTPATAAPPLPAATPTEKNANPPRNLDAPPALGTRPLIVDQQGRPFFAPGTPPQTQKAADAKNDFFLYYADRTRARDSDGLLIAEGNVHLRYRGYEVTCDRATWQRRGGIATLEGNVVVVAERQTVYADKITLDRNQQEFAAREGRTIVPPDLVANNLLEPLRLSGKTVAREGKNLIATDGLLTTCDFPNPHYKIGFSRATVIPGRRIILRNAVIYRYERPVFRIGYLSIPITNEIRVGYLPLVGRTQEEGYFVKAAVGYLLRDQFPGILRVDLMEKKGIGLGFDQAYQFGQKAVGTFLIYSLRDQNRDVNNLNGRINHQQQINRFTRATIATDFQNNSYNSISPTSKTSLTTITTNRVVGRDSTTVSLSLNGSDYGTSRSNTTSYTVTQAEQFRGIGRAAGGGFTFRLNGSESSSTSAFGTTVTSSGRREQSADLRANGKIGRLFDLDFAANRNLASRLTGDGGGGNFFSGTERLPEFTLSTDSTRLGGFLRAVPTRFQLGYGRFVENPTKVTTERTLINVETDPRPFSLTPGRALLLTVGGGFRQTLYDSDAAQYVLAGRSQLTQRLGAQSALNFTYGYLRPYGGQPLNFRLDQTGSNNNLGASLNVNGDRLKLALQTGYDIQRARDRNLFPGVERAPWQNASLQVALRPSGYLQTRFTAAYDINTGRLLDATNRLRIRGKNDFALDTGLRFDPRTKKFPQITETLTTPLFGRDLVLTALAGYNGVTRKFDYKNFGLVRSFHDYEYVIFYRDQPYGFRSEKGISISIRLKAFPATNTPTSGQFGTALDTGTGEVF